MVTSEIFDKLKSLQEILAKKYDIESKIEESPKQLVVQDELLARLKKEYIEKNAKYEETKAKMEAIRAELDEVVKIREDGEKGMDSISTHREYEALEKQINEATERENALRAQLAVEDKDFQAQNEFLQAHEAMMKAQEEDLASGKEQLDKEIAQYNAELDDLKKQEEAVVPGLDQETVYKFERIIQRNSEGIVAVKNGVCMGCQMILPGQFANEVREGEKVLFCPYCSRILYYQEVEAGEEEEYFPVSSTGSLADFEDDFADDMEEESEKELGSELEEDDSSDDDDKDVGFED